MFNAKLMLIAGLLIGLILFNVIAYNQASAMLNFVPSGSRTKPIESLNLFEKITVLFTGVTIPKPQNAELPNERGLSYSSHHFDAGDLTLAAWHIPADEPVGDESAGTILFFHGYANAKSTLLDEAQALHELGYSTFLVDFRGSGGSDGIATTVGVLEANDVAAALSYVRSISADGPMILYGHSMGAAAILRAMATMDIEPDGLIVEAVFAEMLTTVENRFASMGLPTFPAAHALVFWAGWQEGFSGFAHNPVDYAASVDVPILVMHGTDDPRATLEEGERVFEAIAAKEKSFVRFEAVGHESYVSEQREKWMVAVEGFLSEIL